jgi:hypothetical protein
MLVHQGALMMETVSIPETWSTSVRLHGTVSQKTVVSVLLGRCIA